MVSRSLTADQGQEPRVGELLRFCRTVAFLRPNVKVGCQKVNNVRASTFLFSVICDRIQLSPPGLSRRHLVHGRETLLMSPSGFLHDGSHLHGVMRPLAPRNNIVA
jgi:hypothetical protein